MLPDKQISVDELEGRQHMVLQLFGPLQLLQRTFRMGHEHLTYAAQRYV